MKEQGAGAGVPGTARVRDMRTNPWLSIEKCVLDKLGHLMEPRGVAVYAAICRFAGEGGCSPKAIGEMLKMIPATVKACARRLQHLRLVAQDAAGRYVLLDGEAAVEYFELNPTPQDYDADPPAVELPEDAVTVKKKKKKAPAAVSAQELRISPVDPDIQIALLEPKMDQKQKRQAVKDCYRWGWDWFFTGRVDLKLPAPKLEDRAVERQIDRALSYQSLVVVCGAVRGIFLSPHNTGKNDRGELYLDVALALRLTNLTRLYYLWRAHGPGRGSELEHAGGTAVLLERLAEQLLSAAGRVPRDLPDRVLALRLAQDDEIEAELLRLDRIMLDAAEGTLTEQERQVLVTQTAAKRELLRGWVSQEDVVKLGRKLQDQVLRDLLDLPALSLYYDPNLTQAGAIAPESEEERTMGTEAWSQLVPKLREKIEAEEWHTWFVPLRPLLRCGALVLVAPSSRALQTIEESFLGLLQEAAAGVGLAVALTSD